ncbi:DUF2793 domain-containing protein [uncultured Tateyamaria sp.]|uniref:DUF2793 domain-containing protein n=1 Tax=uncultured Tateyamaria sp. TaxID=455651 RepID=UPI00260181ED|nr:DUF2793 domain-containing protein [uncultured Tateyamaria sp.]
MSEVSAILSLPYLQPSQAQKHVTHNEALRQLDTLVQLSVVETGATQPPLVPAAGEVYALAQGASNAWAGQDDKLASFDGVAWHFVTPLVGWRAWDQGADMLKVWDGSAWVAQDAGTQNLTGVGVGTTSDTTNRLAVASEATLLTHAGAGHQLKVNKSTDTDTASLLFQTGFSGRAEMGLTGSDNFAVKVSADGTIWNTGFSIRGANAFMGVGTEDPDTQLHVKGNGNAEVRVETENWGTAIIAAKGRRTGNNAEIAKLCFVNQESIKGSDSAEASMTAVRDGEDGIALALTVSDAGTPVTAFTVHKDGHMDQLRFAPRAAPTAPAAGQVYFDATSAKLRCYDGTSWRDLY